jgi:teichoic acid transport system ATP-binding protein
MTEKILHSIERPPTPSARAPLIEAVGVGVRFSLGSGRDDVQSIAFRALAGKRRREAFWALRDVSFTLHPGDILGVIGANGAGKSTLCRALAGLLRPDEGQLSVSGTSSALLSLGTGFNSELSGRENVMLNGLMLGLTAREIRRLLPEIVDFSGLGPFIDEPLKHYSSGMKSRLGFSIASMIEPDILILDEALSAGDLAFTGRAGDKLRALIAKARAVVVVTHQLTFAETYCTETLWLDAGRVRAAGSASDVVARYRASLPPRRPATLSARPEAVVPAPRAAEVMVVRNVSVSFALTGRSAGGGTRDAVRPRLLRTHRRFEALRDVSFTLNEGDILGLIGPNGAGKSTLCRVLTRILVPDRGTVTVAGDVTALLQFGAGFNGQLTGRDNVFLNGMMLGMSRRRVQSAYPAIVEFAELSRFINEPIKHYSQGMRARLGFSTAASLEPDIFIIDEALNTGDAAFQEKALTRIRELIARARAVILVTHSLQIVERLCTRAICLERGQIVFDGPPAAGVARYRALQARVVAT